MNIFKKLIGISMIFSSLHILIIPFSSILYIIQGFADAEFLYACFLFALASLIVFAFLCLTQNMIKCGYSLMNNNLEYISSNISKIAIYAIITIMSFLSAIGQIQLLPIG